MSGSTPVTTDAREAVAREINATFHADDPMMLSDCLSVADRILSLLAASEQTRERPVDCAACGIVPGPITDEETCPWCGNDAWPAERRMDRLQVRRARSRAPRPQGDTERP